MQLLIRMTCTPHLKWINCPKLISSFMLEISQNILANLNFKDSRIFSENCLINIKLSSLAIMTLRLTKKDTKANSKIPNIKMPLWIQINKSKALRNAVLIWNIKWLRFKDWEYSEVLILLNSLIGDSCMLQNKVNNSGNQYQIILIFWLLMVHPMES